MALVLISLMLTLSAAAFIFVQAGYAEGGSDASELVGMHVRSGLDMMESLGAESAMQEGSDARAQAILDGMSRNEKIAQMMLVTAPVKNSKSIQKKYQFGGYILFSRDFKDATKKSLRKRIKGWQSVSNQGMLIAVDEEGGTVVRASLYSQFRKSRFRSPSQVYRDGGYKEVTSDTKDKDEFLKDLGINCNVGPVADVPYDKSDFIYARAFSTDKTKTGKFVSLAVKRMGKDNVVSVLKHFPGYGGNGDTHGEIIRDTRSLKTFEKRDLKPFKKGISAGTDMIMVSHTIVNAFDKKRPASLSPKVHKYLRETMGYDGVIITDGMAMKGVTEFVGGDEGEAAVRAVKAGNDMLCVTGSYIKTFKAIKKAVKSGEISEEQIDESVLRIIKLKMKRGLI